MRRRRGARDRQSGQAMVEYIYVVPILLLLIFGAIQFGFIYQAKTTLNYATFVAARQGALSNGSMTAILEGLTGGMAPLFTHDRTMDALKAAYQFANGELSNATITRVTIVNPTTDELSAYGVPLASGSGQEIPNDNLMYRPTTINDPSRMNIQDANLLKVRVTYCVRMVVPIINKLIYTFVADAGSIVVPADRGAAAVIVAETTLRPSVCNVADEYRLPINAEAVVRMQTPFRDPVKWVGP